jgi:uncharacterized protein (TIGR03437 family)
LRCIQNHIKASQNAKIGPERQVAGNSWPSAGSGFAQTFSFQVTGLYSYNNPIGDDELDVGLTTATIFGTLEAWNNSCHVASEFPFTDLFLFNDVATTGLHTTIGQGPAIENSQCILDAANSSVTITGSNVTLRLAIAFKAAFGGQKYIYAFGPGSGLPSGAPLTAIGTFTVKPGTPGLPALHVAKAHNGNFSQGQPNATYTVTVSNAAGAAATTGPVTVAESVPAGITLVSMAGSGWTCAAGGSTCTRGDVLNGGATYPPITVTVSVGGGAPPTVTNQVSVSGGGSVTASSSDPTTIAPVTPAGPQITGVVNNSSGVSGQPPGPGIAPSSIFVITGTGLADAGGATLQSTAAPGLPSSLNGASIAVTVNNVTTYPAIYYTSPTQIAAELPALTPVGTGTVTVTYRGAISNAAPVQVVPAALGISTYGGGTAVATDAITGELLSSGNAGAPGEIITLWATGLGTDPGDSDTIFSATPHRVDTPVQVYIGGIQAMILYQGSSGFPGVDQINVTIPQTVPTGCSIPLVAVAGGVMANPATLPIAAGGGACRAE